MRLRLTLALLCLLLAACSRTPLTQRESIVFGTRVEVQVHGDADKAPAAIAAVLQEFDRLHRDYHAWQPSQLTELNAAIAAGKAHTVTPELAAFLADARAFSVQSEGLFDPGIGQLIALWGFQSDHFNGPPPAESAIRAWLQQRPSIRDLEIQGTTVRSRKRGVAIDFGGYLKGVALDHATSILKSHGIRNALVNIGGNLIALGQKGGQPWRVGIQHPRPQQSGGSPLAVLELRDGEAIGTSGDYQRFFEHAGKRYAHLLDPRTGYPATATQAVTVLIPAGTAQPGMHSDAASKPLYLAGHAWLDLGQKTQVTHALRVDADGHVSATPAMQARLGSMPPTQPPSQGGR